jgi:transcriptional regulator NrdR family protein
MFKPARKTNKVKNDVHVTCSTRNLLLLALERKVKTLEEQAAENEEKHEDAADAADKQLEAYKRTADEVSWLRRA